MRMMEVLKRWSGMRAYVETIEPHPSPSLRCGANYTVNVITLPFHRRGIIASVVNMLVWVFKVLRAFVRWRMSGRDFDVVISGHGISDAPLAWLASKLFKTPLVMIFGTVGYTQSLFASYKKLREEGWKAGAAILKSLGDGITMKIAKQASVLFCVSKPVASMLKELGFPKSRIYLTSNGVDMKRIDSVKYDGTKSYDAVFLGRIVKEKGVLDLLKAWKILCEKRPYAKLVVIGSGDQLSEAKHLANELHLDQNVKFTGFIFGDERFVYLKKSKVFIFPSKAREGWSLSISEALSCGLPVVCYDSPTLREIYGDCKALLFVPKGDVERLADTILSLLNDEDVLNYYLKVARDYARRFDWNKIASKELEICKNII